MLISTKTAAVALALLGASCGGEAGTSSSPLVGTWEGYVEAYQFSSGSDRVQFVISAHDEVTGVISGSVVLGDGAPPPPATDPDVGYPPGIANDDFLRRSVEEGFAYALHDATMDGARFRASFYANLLWSDWCALQTPVVFDSGSEMRWSCLPNWSSTHDGGNNTCSQTDPQSGATVAVDCGKLELCNFDMVCSCDANACSADLENAGSFDIALDGDIADGTVTALFGTHNLRLERMP